METGGIRVRVKIHPTLISHPDRKFSKRIPPGPNTSKKPGNSTVGPGVGKEYTMSTCTQCFSVETTWEW